MSLLDRVSHKTNENLSSPAATDFDEFVRTQFQNLLSIAFCITSNRHLAEEVVNKSLAKCQRRWDEINNHYGYARTAVANLAVHVYDKQGASYRKIHSL